MDLAPEYRDRLNSLSPQPNLQEVLVVLGGRSLDDSDEDDSDEDEDRDPRVQRLLRKNCAFYNTKTSTNYFFFLFLHASEFQVCLSSQFILQHFVGKRPSDSLKKTALADASLVVNCSADRKTAQQECGLDVTKLDHLLSSSNERFIVRGWKKESVLGFSWDVKEKIVASRYKIPGFMFRQMTTEATASRAVPEQMNFFLDPSLTPSETFICENLNLVSPHYLKDAKT